jgi:hypothetical protein
LIIVSHAPLINMKLLDCTKGKRLLIANHLDQSMKQYLIASCAQMQCKSHITAPTTGTRFTVNSSSKNMLPSPAGGSALSHKGYPVDGRCTGGVVVHSGWKCEIAPYNSHMTTPTG